MQALYAMANREISGPAMVLRMRNNKDRIHDCHLYHCHLSYQNVLFPPYIPLMKSLVTFTSLCAASLIINHNTFSNCPPAAIF